MSFFAMLKVLHIFSVLLFLTSTTITFFPGNDGVEFKILAGLSSSLILLTGLGLATTFMSFPLWVALKLCLWTLLSVLAPLLARRLKQRLLTNFLGMMALAFAAVAIAVLKPTLH